MYVIIKEGADFTSIYSGIVCHSECGYHAGFMPFHLHTSNARRDDNDVKIYSKKEDAEFDMYMLMEVYSEKHLEVVSVCVRPL